MVAVSGKTACRQYVLYTWNMIDQRKFERRKTNQRLLIRRTNSKFPDKLKRKTLIRRLRTKRYYNRRNNYEN